MKKIFTLFAAMLFALTASAGIIEITPTSPHSKDNLRQALDSAATTGDTIVMAEGTYVESNSNYIAFTGKSVVVMAAADAEVIVQPQVCVRLKSGARAEFNGIKFDCIRLQEKKTDYKNIIVPADDTEGKKVILKNCVFYNDTVNYALITSTSSRRLDSIVVENCYFHDIKKSAIFVENANLVGLKVTNSTFANISSAEGGDYASPIEVKATSGKVEIDHCTFVECATIDASYDVIQVTPNTATSNVTVSNCIFASTAEGGYNCCATNLKAGGTVRNCLVYNLTNWQGKAAGAYGHVPATGVSIISCATGDPKFKDAANADFTLTAGSPALDYAGKDADNSTDIRVDLGNPSLVPAPKTLYCEMKQDWWTTAGAAVGCYAYYNEGEYKNAEYPGVRMTSVEDGVWSYEVSAKYDHVIFTRVNPSGDIADWGYKSYELAIPAQWDYYTITEASAPEGKKASGEWKKLNPTFENGWYLIGVFDGVEAWTNKELSADRKFTKNSGHEFMLTTALVEGDEFKAGYVYYDQITDIKPAGDNYVVDADHAGTTKTIYFNEAGEGGDDWFAHTFYIEKNSATSLDNVLDTEKTVKAIENGQIVIIKNGVRYNVLGTVVR